MRGIRRLPKRRLVTFFALVAGTLVLASCTRTDTVMVKQLAALQGSNGSSTKVSHETVQQLEKEVARYQAEVDRVYASTKKLGQLHEMLALKYFNNEMYGPALRSFKEAIGIYPTNPVLSYMAGLCQAQLARAEPNPTLRTTMFGEAARYYENAIAINGSYKAALFALSVVDVFELGKPKAAQPHLKKLLSLDPSDVNALFLLARVYDSAGAPQQAAGIYDKIMTGKATAEQKTRAQENKRKVLEQAYGK